MLVRQVDSSFPQKFDGPLLVPDGEHFLHWVEGHGRGLVGVAVHQGPLEAQVRSMDLLQDLGLEFVRDSWTEEGDQVTETHGQALRLMNVLWTKWNQTEQIDKWMHELKTPDFVLMGVLHFMYTKVKCYMKLTLMVFKLNWSITQDSWKDLPALSETLLTISFGKYWRKPWGAIRGWTENKIMKHKK